FVLGERDRDGVVHRIRGNFLAVYGQHARASLTQTRAVRLEVEDDGMLAGFEFGPLPHGAFQVEEIVEEHDLATADAELALAQEQAIAAEPPTLGDDHSI